eukprot:gene16938-23211_t
MLVAKWDLTTYKDKSRWYMAPSWPVVAAFSDEFRTQMLTVLGFTKKKEAEVIVKADTEAE